MINFPSLVLCIGPERCTGTGGMAASGFPFCWSSLSIFKKIQFRWELRVLGYWYVHRFFGLRDGVLVTAEEGVRKTISLPTISISTTHCEQLYVGFKTLFVKTRSATRQQLKWFHERFPVPVSYDILRIALARQLPGRSSCSSC